MSVKDVLNGLYQRLDQPGCTNIVMLAQSHAFNAYYDVVQALHRTGPEAPLPNVRFLYFKGARVYKLDEPGYTVQGFSTGSPLEVTVSAELFDHTYDRPHPVNECSPACSPSTAGSPIYQEIRKVAAEQAAAYEQKTAQMEAGLRSVGLGSTIQSEPYVFLTHLNQKLDRLVNARRALDYQRAQLDDEITILSQLIRVAS